MAAALICAEVIHYISNKLLCKIYCFWLSFFGACAACACETNMRSTTSRRRRATMAQRRNAFGAPKECDGENWKLANRGWADASGWSNRAAHAIHWSQHVVRSALPGNDDKCRSQLISKFIIAGVEIKALHDQTAMGYAQPVTKIASSYWAW